MGQARTTEGYAMCQRELFASAVGVFLWVALHAYPSEPPKKMVIAKEPLSVPIAPTEAVKVALETLGQKEPKVVIRLAVEGMIPPENRKQVGGIRVFLNKDNATANTPIDDPHFVTAIDFAPVDARKPMSFNLDLTRALKSLASSNKLDVKKPLRITFVAVPAESEDKLPAELSIPVGSVEIEAVDLGK